MHIITRKRLNEFADKYPEAKTALNKWYQVMKQESFNSLVEIGQIFPTADNEESHQAEINQLLKEYIKNH
jgi:mRNA interferase HigB